MDGYLLELGINIVVELDSGVHCDKFFLILI